MNQLSLQKRASIFHKLVDNCGIRRVARFEGVSPTTVMKFNVDAGRFCEAFLYHTMVNLPISVIQADEIWSFVGTKEDRKRADQPEDWGSTYTWTAIDPKTRLLPCFHVGGREASDAFQFIQKLKYCVHRNGQDLAIEGKNSPFQICTDANKTYLPAIEAIFGRDVNYLQFTKQFYGSPIQDYVRYSMPVLKSAKRRVRLGNPDPTLNTNHVESHNKTIRVNMSRFTRLGDGFSKKRENLRLTFAMFSVHYNFCRVHTAIRVTPAMEAGLTDHIWTHEELMEMMSRPQPWQIAA